MTWFSNLLTRWRNRHDPSIHSLIRPPKQVWEAIDWTKVKGATGAAATEALVAAKYQSTSST